MSDDATPEDHVVLALRIERALLPDWWDVVRPLAARYVRRLALVDRPDEWIVRCELPKARVDEFHDELAEAWATFEAGRSVPPDDELV